MPSGREHDRLGREEDRPTRRPPVAVGPGDAPRPRREAVDRALHVDVDAGRHRPILERADHLEPGPVADVRQPGMRVPAERALQDPTVRRPVEDRAPVLELADPSRRLLGVELGHPGVVEVLSADHRVAEVDLPRIVGGHVTQRGGDATLRHDGVGLSEERLADEPDVGARVPGGDRGPQPCATGPDDQDVVRARLMLGEVWHGRGA